MNPIKTKRPPDGFRARLERGVAPGYSWCLHCGRPWKFVEGHVTPYTPSRGCFPLCEGCWGDMTPEERLPYYVELVRKWMASTDITDPAYFERVLEDWPAIREAVLEGK